MPLRAGLRAPYTPRIAVRRGAWGTRTYVSPWLLLIAGLTAAQRGLHTRDPHVFESGDAARIHPQQHLNAMPGPSGSWVGIRLTIARSADGSIHRCCRLPPKDHRTGT